METSLRYNVNVVQHDAIHGYVFLLFDGVLYLVL